MLSLRVILLRLWSTFLLISCANILKSVMSAIISQHTIEFVKYGPCFVYDWRLNVDNRLWGGNWSLFNFMNLKYFGKTLLNLELASDDLSVLAINWWHWTESIFTTSTTDMLPKPIYIVVSSLLISMRRWLWINSFKKLWRAAEWLSYVVIPWFQILAIFFTDINRWRKFSCFHCSCFIYIRWVLINIFLHVVTSQRHLWGNYAYPWRYNWGNLHGTFFKYLRCWLYDCLARIINACVHLSRLCCKYHLFYDFSILSHLDIRLSFFCLPLTCVLIDWLQYIVVI